MLSASEFTVGCLADATGVSLVLPRNKYEDLCLVTSLGSAATAISLDGDHKFTSFQCADNEAWKGLIVPGVSIEVDEATLFDADGRYPPVGTAVRKGTELSIVSKGENRMYSRTVYCPVAANLPKCREDMAVGFTRWQVVLWRGDEKQVLKVIELKEQSA